MAIRINFPYRTNTAGFSFIADDIKNGVAFTCEEIGLIITAYDITEAVTLEKRIVGGGITWYLRSGDLDATCVRIWSLGDCDPLTLGELDPLTIDDMKDVY